MFRKYFIAVLSVGILFSVNAGAQVDPHSSQYYMNPLFLNPANTGLVPGSYRVAAVYRNQWRSITNAFTTEALTGEINTDNNINFGLNILHQSAGDAGYHYLTGNFSVAYTGLRFGNQQNISLGLQAGFINRRIDPSKFKAGDQWTATTGYSPDNLSSDIIAATSASAFDAGAGFLYFDGRADAKANVYAGFSAFHLTRPKDPFTNTANKKTVPIRYAVHGGISIDLSDAVTAVPNFLYMRQGNAEEKMIGAYFQFKTGTDLSFLTGANYRFNDAAVGFAGLTYKQMTLGVSYDANTSDLGKMVSSANNFEITLSVTGKKRERTDLSYLKCPRL